ncbi:transcriptional regulator [Marinomonas sp. MED121]|uniref:LysR family transcriptional regulator n=1 Tax=Marinomonas sp. MED121 TaxID=314277 RepID=UPI0000690C06|nr:LysR family transcriptional regulator [Marinomonas sp. MED121]EAQ64874.1 transcriptional regulator [Marinomonas sp. MED121]
MHSIRWDDLQYVLTVANEGSVAAAARSLGVNHSTVLRRINTFEHRHKLQLFHKLPTGYKLTAEGQALLDSALSIETTVKALERKIFGQEMKLEGVIKLTTTDALLRLVLAKHLASFHRLHPKIQLELNVTSRLLNLSHLDADIAIRPANTLPESVKATKLCKIAFGIYGEPNYIESLQGKHPLRAAQWLGKTPNIIQKNQGRVIFEPISEEQIVLKADSYEPLMIAAEQGIGLTYMPCFIGDSSQKLQRVDMEVEHKGTDLWMMTHSDLEHSARVKAFFDFMEEEIQSDHNRLAGLNISKTNH